MNIYRSTSSSSGSYKTSRYYIFWVGTGFSTTSLMSSWVEDASRTIKTKWFDVNGPPQMLSGDLEFDNRVFRSLCTATEVQYATRPARRHIQIGSVESANATIRLFVQRLLMDDEHKSTVRGTRKLLYEILSRATFLEHFLSEGTKGKKRVALSLQEGSRHPCVA